MEISDEVVIKTLQESTVNNVKLTRAINDLTEEVKNITDKYKDFSWKMVIIEIEMGFLILLTAGILFK